MRMFVAILLVLFSGEVAAADSTIPCTCRYDGKDMREGEVVCIDLASGRYLARCSKVLNNTAWQKLSDGCDVG